MREQAKELRKKRGSNWKEAADEVGVPMRTLTTCIGEKVLRLPGAATAHKIEAGVVRQTGKNPAPRVRSQAHKRGGDQSSKLSNSVSQEKAAGMLNVSRASLACRSPRRCLTVATNSSLAVEAGRASFHEAAETARRERGPVQPIAQAIKGRPESNWARVPPSDEDTFIRQVLALAATLSFPAQD